MLCLTVPTDPAWASAVMNDLDSVLADHAHCEMKAASNALSLAARHPEAPDVVLALTDLAREEIAHFQEVFAWLRRRGIELGPPPKDPYAVALRRDAVELRPSPLPPLVDRLLVAALIEARSCERFKVIVDALASGPLSELRAFYERLLATEARHYRTFVDLAESVAGAPEGRALARLRDLAALEGVIVQNLSREASRATVHG
jgi:tRNA-(ms[2]io[6]A)-hydroxylase